METFWNLLNSVKSFLSFTLLKIGSMQLTLWTLIYLVVLVYLLFYLSGKLKNLVADKLLARRNIDIGVRISPLSNHSRWIHHHSANGRYRPDRLERTGRRGRHRGRLRIAKHRQQFHQRPDHPFRTSHQDR